MWIQLLQFPVGKSHIYSSLRREQSRLLIPSHIQSILNVMSQL